MSERLICLLSVVLVLCCANNTLAGLVAHWKFNNDAADSVGSLDWTLEGGAGYSTDAREGSHSLSLDGIGGYAAQSGVGVLSNAFSTKTVVFWFKTDANNVTQVLYDEGGAANGLSIRINMRYLQAAARGAGTKVGATALLGRTGWIHAAVTFDSGSLKVYVNGVEQASASASFTTIATHDNRAAVGARDSDDAFGEIGTGDYFAGLIDDVRIYDNVLSADEIKELAADRPKTAPLQPKRWQPKTEPQKPTAHGTGYLDGGIGYAKLSLEGAGNDELSGWGPAFRFWFSDVDDQDGLRPFLGLRNTRYPGDSDEDSIWDISIFAPEIGLAGHQRLGDSGFFLEPSVTAGAAIATYTRRGDFLVSYYLGEDDSATGLVVRPGVLLGHQSDRSALGIEISYGFLDIDFADEVRGTHQELYIGLFGRFSW